MIFNFWRPIWLFMPKKDGWYQCSTGHGGGLNKPRVMDLYFRTWDKKWTDPRRQTVFDGYKVYVSCRAPLEDNRVYTDTNCERIDVVAWRKLPRCYGWWRKRRKKEKNNE